VCAAAFAITALRIDPLITTAAGFLLTVSVAYFVGPVLRDLFGLGRAQALG
jgi:hypothetical protein